jgi:putative membrane protein
MSSEAGLPALAPGRHRLHPAGILVLVLDGLRQSATPLVVIVIAFLLGGGLDADGLRRALGFGLLYAVLAALGGVVTWRTTTYEVAGDALRHQRGLLSVRETDVPLSRVQAVDVVQGPVQRLLGVVAVEVQVAGAGRRAEVALPALSPADARALQGALRRSGPPQPEQAPVGPRRRLGRGELLVTAATAGQLGVILPVVAGASQIADDLWERTGRGLDAGRALVPDTAAEWLLVALAVLALAWLLSALASVVAFAGFEVRREGDRLHIARGLLQRRQATVPVARVQAVRLVEGLLRQPFGLAALRVEVAGYRDDPAAAQTLFPLLRRAEVAAFLGALLPELADEPAPLARPPVRALRRYVLGPAVAGLAAGALAWWLVPGGGPWALALVLPFAAWGALRWRSAGWRLARDGRLALRTRALAQTTVLAPRARLQEHAVRQNPLQRRAGLADLAVAVGAGTRARVRHLEAGTAWGLWSALRR